MTKRPNSRRNLDSAIQREFGPVGYMDARTAMANAIVGGLLPQGVIKGGTALKLRFGNSATRFTTDLDTAWATGLDEFLEVFEGRLLDGWEGFTGHIIVRKPAHPEGVPARYVMQPFDVKLQYEGKPWLTVPMEIGHNEIGDADEVEYGLADDVASIFKTVGLPVPGPSPLMPLHHQIAQKLHGVTEPGSERAHDLIDLQIIVKNEQIDLVKTKATCIRLFAYRDMQDWPPIVTKGVGWDDLYQNQRGTLDVLSTVDEAIAWANELIDKICYAE